MGIINKIANVLLGPNETCGHSKLDNNGNPVPGTKHTSNDGVCIECCNETEKK
jgi:hypothetical protein